MGTRSLALAAPAVAFARAALYRDQLRAVTETLTPQRINRVGGPDQDVIGLYREGSEVQLAVLEVREGRLVGRQGYVFGDQEVPDCEVLSSFVVQLYDDPTRIPGEIVSSRPLPDREALAELLGERAARRVRLVCPGRGPRLAQARLADTNAKALFESRWQQGEALEESLARVQAQLGLGAPPRRIECVDISHLGGRGTVGAVSRVVDGRVDRDGGRTYHVREVADGNDYGALREVLRRRLVRAALEEEGWCAPDLLVIDGGRGQLAVALAVLAELGLSAPPVVAIAKAHAPGETDRIFVPGRVNPLPVRPGVSALGLLALARDEAHRLAVGFQRRVRGRQALGSRLDDVPGVGPRIRARLLRALGSLAAIREADEAALAAVPGVGQKLAARLKAALNDPPADPAPSSSDSWPPGSAGAGPR